MKESKSNQIIIDDRSKSIDLNEFAKHLKNYANRELNIENYANSFKIVYNLVMKHENHLSLMMRKVLKIHIDDEWIFYSNLNIPGIHCPGEESAIEYVNNFNRLPSICEHCRKVLVFRINSKFLKTITEIFLTTTHINFDFKIARDLGVLVGYANEEEEKQKIILFFNNLLKEHHLNGKVQWRIAGKYLQLAAPHLFKSTKELNYTIS